MSHSYFVITDCANNVTSFDKILDSYCLKYRSIDFYWQVGEIELDRGWVIHLSVVRQQIRDLLNVLLSTILTDKIAFRVVRDSQLADFMLEGRLGVDCLCKVISIYPNNDAQALQIANEIIAVTGAFHGPSIPKSKLIAGIVYADFVGLDLQANNQKNDTIIWPFSYPNNPGAATHRKLLNQKYFPFTILKPDARGYVSKALFFEKPWKLKTCIIKQGRKYMAFDDAGRDVRDRLFFQFELHQELASYFPTPKAFDFFTENEAAYLVLEYVPGISMSNFILERYMDNGWDAIGILDQKLLTNYLLDIAKMIARLHQTGYVHRDITPENIRIDKKHRLWLLDLELMWPLNSNKHKVPFQLGTAGFMSPEQQSVEIPTTKEDIYALGAFMLFIFTNLHPLKFIEMSPDELKQAVCFFIYDERIANLIIGCLSKNPTNRINAVDLVSELEKHLEELKSKQSTNLFCLKTHPDIAEGKLKTIIQMAIYGLSNPAILSEKQNWISKLETSTEAPMNPSVGTFVSAGWYNGIAGPLWLLALAKKLSFDIESCTGLYYENWNYIFELCKISSLDYSLYSGVAGWSQALFCGFESHLLIPETIPIQVENFFKKEKSDLSLASGISGQGLALLKANGWIPAGVTQQMLNFYVRTLLSKQSPDGSWQLNSRQNSKRIEFGLSEGVPGILWFLLNYLQSYTDNTILRQVEKGCDWLIKNGFNQKKKKWHLAIFNNSKSDMIFSSNIGIPGLTLVLIKAFLVTGKSRYREIATASLKMLPEKPRYSNFTLGEGLVGLGELYLEAYKAFNDSIWLQRANYISQLLMATFQTRTSSDGHWVMEGDKSLTADLFTGNSGAIHFLMHFLHPGKTHHPLGH